MNEIGAAIAAVRQQIAEAARSCRRDPATIELLVVTKTVSVDRIRQALEAGVRSLGENRVQEAEDKVPLLPPSVHWHLIGKLQRNKVRRAVRCFDTIHSVDRMPLARALQRAAEQAGRQLDVYVQVDYARSGLPLTEVEEQARRLCSTVHDASGLRLLGLMTLPPYDPDPETARPWFARLASLRDRIGSEEGLTSLGLSMGMSNDFCIAVQEGATIVRVGSRIFGPRG